MKLILSFILLMFSSSVSLAAYNTNQEAEQDATKAIAQAFYKQSGIEDNITNKVKDTIPKKYEATIANVTTIISTLVSQKVELRWTF